MAMRWRLNVRRLLLIALAVHVLVVVSGQAVRIVDMSRDLAALRRQIEGIRAENETLRRETQLLMTVEYIERLAREELGMVWPGEVPYMRAIPAQLDIRSR